MLVSLNAQRVYELAKYVAESKNKYIAIINNVKWSTLDATKQATVKTYYEDTIPTDEIGEVFGEHYTIYEFNSQAVAIDTMQDWIPLSTDLTDQDYFIHVQVVTPAGGMPYDNLIPDKPAE